MTPYRALITACMVLLHSECWSEEPPSLEQGALARGFALPNVGRPEITAAGRTRHRVELGAFNEYKADSNPNEAIVVDGEAARLIYDVRYGIDGVWDVGAFVPVLIQGGGFLDGFIEGWHRTFNLPNAGREDVPRNRYLYRYSRNGQLLIDAEHSSNGLGDIQLNAGRRVTDDVAVRTMLKLPTGSSSHLAGNGAFGGAAWLDARLPVTVTGAWSVLGAVGLSYTARGDVIPDQQERLLPFGSISVGYRFTDRLAAQVQIYAHAAPYKDSEMIPLVHIGVPLNVSASYRWSKTTVINLGFQEKANYGASPDFGIFLGLDLH